MFVTDFVRNIAWSLRRSRAQMPNPDSVLPADAVSPVTPSSRDRRRPLAQEIAEDRLSHPAPPAEMKSPAEVDTPQAYEEEDQEVDSSRHIDVRV